jgi:hypothetical protein
MAATSSVRRSTCGKMPIRNSTLRCRAMCEWHGTPNCWIPPRKLCSCLSGQMTTSRMASRKSRKPCTKLSPKRRRNRDPKSTKAPMRYVHVQGWRAEPGECNRAHAQHGGGVACIWLHAHVPIAACLCTRRVFMHWCPDVRTACDRRRWPACRYSRCGGASHQALGAASVAQRESQGATQDADGEGEGSGVRTNKTIGTTQRGEHRDEKKGAMRCDGRTCMPAIVRVCAHGLCMCVHMCGFVCPCVQRKLARNRRLLIQQRQFLNFGVASEDCVPGPAENYTDLIRALNCDHMQ